MKYETEEVWFKSLAALRPQTKPLLGTAYEVVWISMSF